LNEGRNLIEPALSPVAGSRKKSGKEQGSCANLCANTRGEEKQATFLSAQKRKRNLSREGREKKKRNASGSSKKVRKKWRSGTALKWRRGNCQYRTLEGERERGDLFLMV